jgi:hypothetical protein
MKIMKEINDRIKEDGLQLKLEVDNSTVFIKTEKTTYNSLFSSIIKKCKENGSFLRQLYSFDKEKTIWAAFVNPSDVKTFAAMVKSLPVVINAIPQKHNYSLMKKAVVYLPNKRCVPKGLDSKDSPMGPCIHFKDVSKIKHYFKDLKENDSIKIGVPFSVFCQYGEKAKMSTRVGCKLHQIVENHYFSLPHDEAPPDSVSGGTDGHSEKTHEEEETLNIEKMVKRALTKNHISGVLLEYAIIVALDYTDLSDALNDTAALTRRVINDIVEDESGWAQFEYSAITKKKGWKEACNILYQEYIE